jgi:hypothetical protein
MSRTAGATTTKNGEKVWIYKKANFFYLRRGVARTPAGTGVEIIQCNDGIVTSEGSLKGTVTYGLRNKDGEMRGQMIAFSTDREDLELFAMEYDWRL